ncbi:unnamed protein product [Gadus morhua 'NCC']
MSPGSNDSVDQSRDSACSSNLPAPFQASQYPNGGVLETSAKQVRLSTAQSGSRPLWAVETRTAPHLCKTEPNPPVEMRYWNQHRFARTIQGTVENVPLKDLKKQWEDSSCIEPNTLKKWKCCF